MSVLAAHGWKRSQVKLLAALSPRNSFFPSSFHLLVFAYFIWSWKMSGKVSHLATRSSVCTLRNFTERHTAQSTSAGLCACAVLSSAQGQGPQQPQQPQQPPQPGPCTTGLEEQLPTQCFGANGVDYQGVLFLLSGNRTGAIPAGYDFASFRKALCEWVENLAERQRKYRRWQVAYIYISIHIANISVANEWYVFCVQRLDAQSTNV